MEDYNVLRSRASKTSTSNSETANFEAGGCVRSLSGSIVSSRFVKVRLQSLNTRLNVITWKTKQRFSIQDVHVNLIHELNNLGNACLFRVQSEPWGTLHVVLVGITSHLNARYVRQGVNLVSLFKKKFSDENFPFLFRPSFKTKPSCFTKSKVVIRSVLLNGAMKKKISSGSGFQRHTKGHIGALGYLTVSGGAEMKKRYLSLVEAREANKEVSKRRNLFGASGQRRKA